MGTWGKRPGKWLEERASDANSGHETISPSASAESGPPPPLDRAAERGPPPQTDPHLRPRRFWQDHAGQRMDRRYASGRSAWLSLDEGDSDPARFLAYLVAALRTIAANIGEGVLAVLQSPQPPPTESILTALLNEIAAIPDNFILVLDDYHVIDAKPVDQALAFLLEHLPPQMHLVIATREDPHLPLARLRARGQLTELRAADLRFTPAETAEFLNQVMGLNLSAEDIAALETRTEGWIAGLQLAAISMQGHDKTPPASSNPSPAATISCWTIWWKKSCNGSPKASRLSCCAHPSSTACAVPCVMPFCSTPAGFRAGDPGISRTRQPVHRSPGQRAALVPLSPSLCGFAAAAAAPEHASSTGDEGWRSRIAHPRQPVVRRQWPGDRSVSPCGSRQ